MDTTVHLVFGGREVLQGAGALETAKSVAMVLGARPEPEARRLHACLEDDALVNGGELVLVRTGPTLVDVYFATPRELSAVRLRTVQRLAMAFHHGWAGHEQFATCGCGLCRPGTP